MRHFGLDGTSVSPTGPRKMVRDSPRGSSTFAVASRVKEARPPDKSPVSLNSESDPAWVVAAVTVNEHRKVSRFFMVSLKWLWLGESSIQVSAGVGQRHKLQA